MNCDGETMVDTSCLFLTRAAFSIVPMWTLMPDYAHAIDDRVMWHYIKQAGLSRVHTGKPTVAYRMRNHGSINQWVKSHRRMLLEMEVT
jgi:hypothetical protein